MRKLMMIIAMALFTVGLSANVKDDVKPLSYENVQALEQTVAIANATLIAENNAKLYASHIGGCIHFDGGVMTVVMYDTESGTGTIDVHGGSSTMTFNVTAGQAKAECDRPRR